MYDSKPSSLAQRVATEWAMTTGRAEAKEVLPRDQARRQAIVTQMLDERSRRQSVSREEIRKMRAEGRF